MSFNWWLDSVRRAAKAVSIAMIASEDREDLRRVGDNGARSSRGHPGLEEQPRMRRYPPDDVSNP